MSDGVTIHDEVFLHYEKGTSDKGYLSKLIEANGTFFHFYAYGKRYGTKTEQVKDYPTREQARQAHAAKVREQLAQGYKEVSASDIACTYGAAPKAFAALRLNKAPAPVFAQPASAEIGSGKRVYSFEDEE
jgi:hypothetical protein